MHVKRLPFVFLVNLWLIKYFLSAESAMLEANQTTRSRKTVINWQFCQIRHVVTLRNKGCKPKAQLEAKES